MAGLLDEIVAAKRGELARDAARLPAEMLARLLADALPPRPFARTLRGEGVRLIAEVKRASPSRGILRPERPWDGAGLACAYEGAGAVALSVLTDVRFFWGSPDELVACRAATALPVLRKDFLLSPYHVDQSRWLGADAVLLLVRLLEPATLRACARRALDLGMSVVVEVHHDAELPAALALCELGSDVVVGVNHRDLDTLSMDMERALRLRPRIPRDVLVVAESGVANQATVRRLCNAGIDAFLVGEHLAAAADPAAALRALRGA